MFEATRIDCLSLPITTSSGFPAPPQKHCSTPVRSCRALQPAGCGVCTCAKHPAEAEVGDGRVPEGAACLTAPGWKLWLGQDRNVSISLARPAPRNEAVAEARRGEELL